jgi:hypothetical protein
VDGLNDSREILGGDMEITMDYYRSEYMKFRGVMCSPKYTIKQKEDAFKGVAWVYLNTKTDSEEDKDALVTSFQALTLEYEMRMLYERGLK